MDRSHCIKNYTGRILRYGFVAIALLVATPPARAASVTFNLNQSNALPDGTSYLSVMLTENGTGGVDVLVKTLTALNSIATSNFGMQNFGFSLGDGVSGIVSGLPGGWSIKTNKNMSEFGKYDFLLHGTGHSRKNELIFTVNGVTLEDFDSMMATHVAGFEWCDFDSNYRYGRQSCRNCETSAYFAGSFDYPSETTVPAPAAMWLFGSGLAGLLGLASRRNRKKH